MGKVPFLGMEPNPPRPSPQPGEIIISKGRIIDVDPPIEECDKIEFSRHALDQMKARDISQDDVVRTLRNPHVRGLPTQILRHRVRRSKGAKRAVDVVYQHAGGGKIIVITAIMITLN